MTLDLGNPDSDLARRMGVYFVNETNWKGQGFYYIGDMFVCGLR